MLCTRGYLGNSLVDINLVESEQEDIQYNRARWNELTSLQVESDFYDVEGFKGGRSFLNQIEIEVLGDVRGKKILHLQCFFRLDTHSVAQMGGIFF